MTIDNWIGIRQYQETHQDLYKKVNDSTETLADYLDPSYTVCNVANTARSIAFDTFGIW